MKEPVRVDLPNGWVDLEPEVTIPMGAAAVYVVFSMADTASEADLREALAPVLVRHGIRDWSFRDGLRSIKVEPDSIERLLPWATAGFEVADRCMDLYLADIIRPLVARRDRLSGIGPKETSTSPNPDSGTPPPTQSEPSSPRSTDGMQYEDQV